MLLFIDTKSTQETLDYDGKAPGDLPRHLFPFCQLSVGFPSITCAGGETGKAHGGAYHAAATVHAQCMLSLCSAAQPGSFMDSQMSMAKSLSELFMTEIQSR